MIADLINNGSDIGLPLTESPGLPNLGGRKIEIVVGNCVTPETALSEAERLIAEEGVVALCGLYGSAATKTALVSSEKYGIPLLSPASSESLSTSGNKYFFRSTAHDGQYVEYTYQFIDYLNAEQNAGIKTIGIVCEDTDFGANLAISAANTAGKHGYTVVANIPYSASANNFSSEIMQLKKANPDAVIMATYTSDGILLVKTMKEQNFLPKAILGQRAGFQQTDFLATLGADAEYLFSTSPWAADLGQPMATKLKELFKTQYSGGTELIGWVASAMVDFYVIALAYNQAGKINSDAFRDAMMSGLEFDPAQQFAAVSSFEYDDQGQIKTFLPIMMQVQDGAYHTIYPTEKATGTIRFPVPAWTER